jgi:hypothetical protein
MSQYPNSGSLFKVDEKFRTNEKSPIMKGKIELGEDMCDYIQQQYRAGKDVIIDVSAWSRVAAGTGNKFLSLSVQKEWVKEGAKDSPTSNKSVKTSDMESDIPF